MTTTAKPVKATTAAAISPTPALDRIIRRDPDIVDRMFDYLLQQMPELAGRAAELDRAEQALRDEFRARRGLHVRSPRRDDERQEIIDKVASYPSSVTHLSVALALGVSKATVRRIRSMLGAHTAP